MAIEDRDFEALLSASGLISVFVWENRPGWPVTYVTENVVRLLGITKSDFERFGITYERLVHPDDYERMNDEIVQAMNDPTQPASFTHTDYRLFRADGEVIWVSDTTIMQRAANGEVTFLFGYIIDITERKMLELALEQERNRLTLLVEGTRVGTWDWEPKTDKVAFNQRWAEMLGVNHASLKPSLKSVIERIHPEDFDSYQQKIYAHLRGETEFYESVHRMRHEQGHYLYVLDRGRITEHDALGKAAKFISTLTDISAQKEAELRARRASQTKNLFLANISHEIRTPLHGILGITELLQNTNLDDRQRELVGTIQRSGGYLLNTLNDVLDLTSAEEGKLKVVRKAENPRRIIKHIEQLYGQTIRLKGIDFEVGDPTALPELVVMDHARMIQVVGNLVSNAIKFTDAGRIVLQMRWESEPNSDDGLLVIQVTDTGIGIKDTQRIWQMFEQEQSELNRKQAGSGLGLAIVRNLVKLLNGEIKVHSQLGEGSTFEVKIPAREASPSYGGHYPKERTADSRERLADQANPVRILVVDDSEVNQLIIAEMLTSLDLFFVQERDATRVLPMLEADHFDIVFMDIHLPEVDGLELTRKIRRMDIAQPYIIALTANAFEETRAESKQVGMNDYVTKPFLFEQLHAALKRAFDACKG